MPTTERVLSECLYVQIDTQPWLLWYFKIAIDEFYWFIHNITPWWLVGLVFKNEKVLSAGSKMDIHGGGNRSARIVRRHAYVVRIRHGGNLFHFPQTAGQADIWLNNINRL